MAIIRQFEAFRDAFALHGRFVHPQGGDVLTYLAPDQLIRASGDWPADGFEAGQRVQLVGSTSNDGYRVIESIDGTDTKITTVEKTITTEAAVAGTIVDAVHIDPGGHERWPVDLVNITGGPGPLTGLSKPFVPLIVPIALTVNGVAADAVLDEDEYDWYLSQRTDDPDNQYLSIDKSTGSDTQSFSGTVRFDRTALADSEFGTSVGQPLTPIQTAKLFNRCYLYVQRRSDREILFVNLLELQTAPG